MQFTILGKILNPFAPLRMELSHFSSTLLYSALALGHPFTDNLWMIISIGSQKNELWSGSIYSDI